MKRDKDKKQATKKLLKSDEKLKFVLEAVKAGTWEWDLESDEHYWTDELWGLYCLDNNTQKAGYDLWMSSIHPDDRETVGTAVLSAVRKGTELNIEWRVNTTDGTKRWLTSRGQPVYGENGKITAYQGICRDITDQREDENERQIIMSILGIMNSSSDMQELMNSIILLLKTWSGCEAVGIRHRDGQDFPYFTTSGFPQKFVQLESSLCARDQDGNFVTDCQGNPVLECMCGNIILGRFNPDFPFFTRNGSFWTNSTTELLASTTDKERQARTRNRCNGEGYESVALVPLKYCDEPMGLLQFNDPRKGMFDHKIIGLLERLAASIAMGLAHRKVSQDLKQSERLLNDAQEIAKIGGWEYDPSRNSMRWTRECYHIHELESIEGKPGYNEHIEKSLDCYDPEDRPKILDAFLRCVKHGEPYNLEFPFTTAKGRRIWIQTSARAVINGDKVDKVIGTIMDITEYKNIEKALKESRQLYEKIFRLNPAGIAITRESDGYCYDTNFALEKITGYSRDEVIGHKSSEFGVWENPQDRQGIIDQINENGYVNNIEISFPKRSGECFTGLLSIAPVKVNDEQRLIHIITDITERKNFERRVTESEAKWRSYVENAPVGVVVVDLSGRHVECNRAAEEILGSGQGELFGTYVSDFLAEEFQAAGEGHFLVAKKAGKADGELMLKRKDGSEIWAQVMAAKISEDRIMAVFQDITEHKKILNDLFESEEKYKRLYEEAPVGVFRTDSSGKALNVNKAMADILGFKTPQDAIAFYDNIGTQLYISSKRRDEFLNLLNEHGYVENFDYEARTFDNRQIWLTMSAWKRETAENGKFIIEGFTTDITARKNAEEEYQTLFMQMSEGFAFHEIICDEYGSPVNYRFLRVNPAFEEITGLKAEKIIGRTVLDIMPDIERSWIEIYGDVALTGKPKKFKNFTKPLEKFFEVTAFCPLPNHFACIFNDVTEREAAYKALKESEDKARSILNSSPEAIVLVDPYGIVVDSNYSYSSQFNMTRDEIIGKCIGDILPSTIKNLSKIKINEAFRTGKSVVFQEENEGKWFERSIAPVFDTENNSVKYVVQESLDITEQKFAELEKANLESQLQQAQKMESIGRLAGGVAHDFNNMLSVIIGNTELALISLGPDQPVYEKLNEVKAAAKRSADLTRQLLAFARKQTITPKVINLNEIIGSMLKMLKRLIGEDINLNWSPADGLWMTKMDPTQIDQILANLCVNSRDAIKGNGQITVKTGNVLLDDNFCLKNPGYVPGEYVMIFLEDNGYGMSQAILDRLFEPFFTTKEAGKGTGLGLATVYGIVKQNNGYINVTSEPGSGTNFTIYLPKFEGDQENGIIKEGANSFMRGRGTIVLVEDEANLLTMTKKILEHFGYTVLPASTPGEAVKIAEKYSGDLSLLITDVVMPEMNGINLAKKIAGIHPNMKCLFISGYTEDMTALTDMIAEGKDFLAKPFSVNGLIEKVHKILNN